MFVALNMMTLQRNKLPKFTVFDKNLGKLNTTVGGCSDQTLV